MISMRTLRNDQRGMSSLLFTLIMMIVISLIVVGFAQLARRGQREALDNQLSSQAYYAAESGVNDAVHVLQANPAAGNANSIQCGDFITANNLNTQINAGAVKYTCLFVNSGPLKTLVYDHNVISPTNAQVIPINPTGGSLNSLTITWNTPDGSTNPTQASTCNDTSSSLPAQKDYKCVYPMLRIDLVPTSKLDNRADADSNTLTEFIKPTSSRSNGNGTFDMSNRLVEGFCNGTNCSYTIGGLAGKGDLLLHVSSVYNSTKLVTVDSSDPAGVELSGAQAIIDSTGQAQDVLRRIQVRVPIGSRSVPVSGAIESNQSICKRFTVGDGVAYNDSGCSIN